MLITLTLSFSKFIIWIWFSKHRVCIVSWFRSRFCSLASCWGMRCSWQVVRASGLCSTYSPCHCQLFSGINHIIYLCENIINLSLLGFFLLIILMWRIYTFWYCHVYLYGCYSLDNSCFYYFFRSGAGLFVPPWCKMVTMG